MSVFIILKLDIYNTEAEEEFKTVFQTQQIKRKTWDDFCFRQKERGLFNFASCDSSLSLTHYVPPQLHALCSQEQCLLTMSAVTHFIHRPPGLRNWLWLFLKFFTFFDIGSHHPFKQKLWQLTEASTAYPKSNPFHQQQLKTKIKEHINYYYQSLSIGTVT